MSKNDIVNDLREKIATLETCADSSEKRHNRSTRASMKNEAVSSDEDAAFKRLLLLVNASDKSKMKLLDRLKRAGFDEEVAQSAIDRAEQCGIVDDMRFADVLIRSRLNQGKGISGIERELKENGIDPGSVAGWPYDYTDGEESEKERALQFITRHPSRSKNPRDAAYRKLVSKGYSSSAASYAARIWSESLETSDCD